MGNPAPMGIDPSTHGAGVGPASPKTLWPTCGGIWEEYLKFPQNHMKGLTATADFT